MAVKFVYKAKDPAGKTRLGEVEAVSIEQAKKTLQENKLLIIKLKEKSGFSLTFLTGKPSGVSGTQIAQFTRLLGTMLQAGLPLVDSLSDLALQTEAETFRDVIWSVLRDVQGGSALSDSLGRFPKVFSRFYVSLIRAGEASGKVPETLISLADTLEAALEFKAKIKGALLYPVIIVIAMAAVASIMITSIIPRIGAVYKEFGAELPLPTRILMGLSDFITNYFLLAAVLGLVLLGAYKAMRKNPVADLAINNLLFRLPIFGKMNEEVELTNTMRVLGTLVGAGVGIVDTLTITAETLHNNYLREAVLKAVSDVESGFPLSYSLKGSIRLPLIVSQLVQIGEETGTVSDSLLRLVGFFQTSAERRVKMLTTALEPVLILIMGVGVGGLAIAVLMPMFNLISVIK